jgi:hypothetical protein
MAGLKVLWIYCWYSVKWNLFLWGLLICFEENMDLEQHTNNSFFPFSLYGIIILKWEE